MTEERKLPDEEMAAVMEWHPIETAPKDGTHVLLATNVDPPAWVCEGYYEQDDDRGWYQANTHWTDHYDGQVWPSYWMPLPAPPALAAYMK